jgi:hypothetical protein
MLIADGSMMALVGIRVEMAAVGEVGVMVGAD